MNIFQQSPYFLLTMTCAISSNSSCLCQCTPDFGWICNPSTLTITQKLIDRGHRVIIITHAYGPPHDSYPTRTGIRYLTNRVKVYHLPHWVVYRSTTFPTVFSSFPVLRQIFIREQIQIVHGHGSLSNLCHEGMLHARTMGLVTAFTDHSLFGFSDAASILANKLLKFSLSDVGHVVCVSHTWYEYSLPFRSEYR